MVGEIASARNYLFIRYGGLVSPTTFIESDKEEVSHLFRRVHWLFLSGLTNYSQTTSATRYPWRISLEFFV
jgi:hypothetical protein